MTSLTDRGVGALLGLACGDAVGTTVEFAARGSFEPLTDMVGGGPFGLLPGEWTDDTSMALCLADSLLSQGGFDPIDQLERYVRWFREGYLSSNGECFDIGNTVHQALLEFERTGRADCGATGDHTAGNGSIMRLAPVILFYFPDRESVDRYAAASSVTTHGAAEAIASCRILAGVLYALLDGQGKDEALRAVAPADWMSPRLRGIAAGDYVSKGVEEITGTGYAVASLEAALWCFMGSETFEEAILMAANLGDDADTTAAVCGQLAGVYYGVQDIPQTWLSRLSLRDKIVDWGDKLVTASPPEGPAG